jgi:large subunit ribosomal protein L29
MTGEELRVLDREELVGQLKTSRRELYELRFKLAVGQLDDHRQIRKVRHDIARILTSLRQRELGLVSEEEHAPAAPAAAVAEGTAAARAATAVRAAVETETEDAEEETGTAQTSEDDAESPGTSQDEEKK